VCVVCMCVRALVRAHESKNRELVAAVCCRL